MLLLNQLRHEVNYILPFCLLLGPAKESAQACISLEYIPKIMPISIDYDEIGVVPILLI
jgi:hypothetical protein